MRNNAAFYIFSVEGHGMRRNDAISKSFQKRSLFVCQQQQQHQRSSPDFLSHLLTDEQLASSSVSAAGWA